MKGLSLIAVILTGGVLIYAVLDFPEWGDVNSAPNRYQVSQRYITESYRETGVPNMVTAVLADYRGYDTLFEVVVILTAGIAISGILRRHPGRTAQGPRQSADHVAKRDFIVVTTCRVLAPVIQLFALYVVAHGHHSPGGGFQGGVIFGASLILMALARDLPTALLRFPERMAVMVGNSGVLIYVGIGLVCLLLSGSFLDYGALDPILPGDRAHARSLAIMGVEFGVALTVSAVMFFIYAHLASGGGLKEGL